MHIYIKDIMQTAVTMVKADATVEEAETLMLKTNRRCVPVVDDLHHCLGVVSYIDILKLRSQKENLSRMLVSEMCSEQVRTVTPHNSVDDAMELMLEQGVHHVFVLQNGKMAGVVSVMDIIQINKGMLFNPDDELNADSRLNA